MGGWPTRPPAAAGGPFESEKPLKSEKKYRLKRRQYRLQLRRNPHGLKFLQLFRAENGGELRKKGLLCLSDLLLQSMNLDDGNSDLCRVPAGIQQDAKLLNQTLSSLKKRHQRCLACLQQLLEFAHLAGLQLQKRSHNLQWRRFFAARLNACGLQLLQDLFDV
jgi:hypothetical protein